MIQGKLPLKTNSNNLAAIIWMSIAALTLSLNISLTKLLVETSSPAQIFFIKNALVIMLLFPAKFPKLKRNGLKVLKLSNLYYIRAILLTVNFIIWYHSLKHVSIIEAISITYLTPILNLIAGFSIFKERINYLKILSIILAFIGVIIILRPGFREFNIWLYIIVGVAIIWSVIDIICKIQVSTEETNDLILYNSILVLIFSAPYCLSQAWSSLSFKYSVILLLASFAHIANLYSFFRAYKVGELTVIVPVDCLKIFFSLLISYIFYNKAFSLLDLVGTFLLIGATIGLVYQEKI